jgi:malate dehydrogenase (oxaloacetate-decarboxylating)(NADP+)
LEIAKDVNNVYKYTAKEFSCSYYNGTAVLGLGDIGPEASKPVMEGKPCCLKSLLILMFFDIEVDLRILTNSLRQ